MPRGDKSTYTDKQKRQAEHIEEGYEKRGVPEDEARRDWELRHPSTWERFKDAIRHAWEEVGNRR